MAITIEEATPIVERLLEKMRDFPKKIALCDIGTGPTDDGRRVMEIQVFKEADLERMAAMCGATVTARLVDEDAESWIHKAADLGGGIRLICWKKCTGKKEAAPGDSSTEDGGTAQ